MRFPCLAGLLFALTPLLRAQQAALESSARVPDLRFAPQRWALVIGANDYEHLGALRYARDDARAFAAALETHLGFTADGVKLLTDDAEDGAPGPPGPSDVAILRSCPGVGRVVASTLLASSVVDALATKVRRTFTRTPSFTARTSSSVVLSLASRAPSPLAAHEPAPQAKEGWFASSSSAGPVAELQKLSFSSKVSPSS